MKHTSFPKRFWTNVRDLIRRHCGSEPVDKYAVAVLPTGLSVTLDTCRGPRGRLEAWSVEWSEISSVLAFKTDNFAYDTIWIAVFPTFVSEEGVARILIPDDADGWEDALRSLPEHLAGCEPFEEWFGPVAFPPFVTNRRVIYERKAA